MVNFTASMRILIFCTAQLLGAVSRESECDDDLYVDGKRFIRLDQ